MFIKKIFLNKKNLRLLFFSFFLLFPFYGKAIYNLKSNKSGSPQNIEAKHWLLVSQGCHSCSELLSELTKICSNQKPAISKIGFFATGSDPSALLKKLEDFKDSYEIFSGSPNEFYQSYNMTGSPSLKMKNKKKVIVGKKKILKFLKKDSDFCPAAKKKVSS